MRVFVAGDDLGAVDDEALDEAPRRAAQLAGDGKRAHEVGELVVPDAGRGGEYGRLAVELGAADLVGIAGADAYHQVPTGLGIGDEVGHQPVGGEIERRHDEGRQLARQPHRVGELEIGGM